jgi:hypothetical protein
MNQFLVGQMVPEKVIEILQRPSVVPEHTIEPSAIGKQLLSGRTDLGVAGHGVEVSDV